MADEVICSKCEVPISDSKVTIEGRSYHTECLACDKCKKPISVGSVYEIDGQIIDEECYKNHYGENDSEESSICRACEALILDNKLSFEGRSYHIECLACDLCNKKISGGSIYEIDGQIIDEECYRNHYADEDAEEGSICNKCEAPILDSLATFDGKSYHSKCLVCGKCEKPIAGGSVYKVEGEAIDEDCYKNHYAKKCALCHQLLMSPGEGKYITYGFQTFHPECFRCYKCDKTLAGSKFYTVEEGRVCVECHAKKCAVCHKLLIYPDKEKYVRYGDNSYHAECFCCSKCQETLHGKKFYNLADGNTCVKCYEEEKGIKQDEDHEE